MSFLFNTNVFVKNQQWNHPNATPLTSRMSRIPFVINTATYTKSEHILVDISDVCAVQTFSVACFLLENQ